VKNAARPAIFKWRQTAPELIVCAVRWYLRYSLSLRDVEELLAERGLAADHTTIWRWVQRYGPELEQRLRRHLKPTNKSWRVDETYIRVKGRWCYLYRAIDSAGVQPAGDQVAMGLPQVLTKYLVGPPKTVVKNATCLLFCRRTSMASTNGRSNFQFNTLFNKSTEIEVSYKVRQFERKLVTAQVPRSIGTKVGSSRRGLLRSKIALAPRKS
jgi:IS6 family transposase